MPGRRYPHDRHAVFIKPDDLLIDPRTLGIIDHIMNVPAVGFHKIKHCACLIQISLPQNTAQCRYADAQIEVIFMPQDPLPDALIIQKNQPVRCHHITVHAIGIAEILHHRIIQERLAAEYAELDAPFIERARGPVHDRVDNIPGDPGIFLPELFRLITIGTAKIAVLRHQKIDRCVFLLAVRDRADIKHAFGLVSFNHFPALHRQVAARLAIFKLKYRHPSSSPVCSGPVRSPRYLTRACL